MRGIKTDDKEVNRDADDSLGSVRGDGRPRPAARPPVCRCPRLAVTYRALDEPGLDRLEVDVEEKDGKYLITAPLAGFKPEEVDVTVADGVLTINAQHSEEKKTDRKGYIRRELVSGNFCRQIPVGDVDPSAIKAEFENGVLKVSLPAPSKPEPVKIAVKSGDSGSESQKELAA